MVQANRRHAYHSELRAMIAREAAAPATDAALPPLDQQRERDDTDEQRRSGCKSFQTHPRLQGPIEALSFRQSRPGREPAYDSRHL